MSEFNIPKEVRDFVFTYIDSAEQLEILLLLSSDSNKAWSSEELNSHLRSNLNSVEKRLRLLTSQGLLKKNEDLKYFFSPENSFLDHAVSTLAEVCKFHRHKVYELIFSPMKKIRDFADAFKIATSKKHKGDQNG